MPLRLLAAILSRMRSPVTSRSNWANDSSTLSVSRPMLVVVLNAWVTDTNETPCPSNSSTNLAKSDRARVSRSTLYTTITSTRRASHLGEQPLQGGAFERSAGEAAVVVAAGQQAPALVRLGADVGLGRLALVVEGVELLIEPVLGRDPGVDRAAQRRPCAGGRCLSWFGRPGTHASTLPTRAPHRQWSWRAGRRSGGRSTWCR